MSFILIGILMVSKMFYLSIFKLGDFNFTLSDACLIAFLASILVRFFTADDLRDTYDSYIYDYLRRMLIFVVGAFILNIATTMAAGAVPIVSILNIFKKWLSLIIIPFYFAYCVKAKERIVWLCIAVIVFYALMNYGGIVAENAERYYAEDEFNPNVLGSIFGLIMIYMINSKYNNAVKIAISLVSIFMIFACSTRGAVLSVAATMVVDRFFVSEKGDAIKNIRKILFYAVLAIVGLFVASRLVPAATERIAASFRGGITQTSSFLSRMDSTKKIIGAFISFPRLALFGTGFGTFNEALVLSRYGYAITTSDNMYVDLICWIGIVGIPFAFFYFKDLFRLSCDINKKGYKSALMITIYMLLLGLTQGSILDPTVGGVYYVLLSYEMIRAMDKEEAERVGAEQKETGDEGA